jgi:hypothetical protein
MVPWGMASWPYPMSMLDLTQEASSVLLACSSLPPPAYCPPGKEETLDATSGLGVTLGIVLPVAGGLTVAPGIAAPWRL